MWPEASLPPDSIRWPFIIRRSSFELWRSAFFCRTFSPPGIGGGTVTQGQGEREFLFTLTFAEENGELVGTMMSQRGERALSDVKFEDGVITAKMENPNFFMNFKAEIDGDSLKGTMSSDRFDMEFTGTRK